MQNQYPQTNITAPEMLPAQSEFRRTIRNVCLTYAGFMLAVMLLGSLIFYGYIIVNALAQNDFSMTLTSYALLDDSLQETTEEIAQIGNIAQLLSVLLAALLFLVIRGKRLFTTDISTKRESPSAMTVLSLFALVFGVQFFMIILNMITAPLFEQVEISLTEPMDEGVDALLIEPVGLLYVVLLGPLLEEIVFRGAILRSFERFGANFAMIASAVLFGLYHIILYQAVFAFLLGIVLAYTAGRFSLKWALLLHVVNNSVAVSSVYIQPWLGEFQFSLILTGLFFAGFLFSIIYVLIYKQRVLKAQKIAGAPVVAQPFKTFFAHPTFVVPATLIVAFGVIMLLPA